MLDLTGGKWDKTPVEESLTTLAQYEELVGGTRSSWGGCLSYERETLRAASLD